ncbi:diguanylate cyclase [Thauera sp. CAU 1555]|uniref:Diguanylate cyclase n=1 Tax=Thauera sedimentorum TaxID=2767595 RepID=A0ABR9BBW8_9RHOO|nr:diguanylate cyclase [Thauera sedimentorum]MBC9072066.1 diguanylate cyclase [Thauera sedimentorum]MBD8502985.1 diguanylate cyclase [Thauera sedimentorum]
MSSQRVLLIDDDEVDRRLARRALSQAGWQGELVEAPTADEARSLAATQHFDCFLLDYHLPGTDGLTLLAELRSTLAPQVPVVMLTGEGNEMIAVQAMKGGACDYLPKALLAPDTLHRALTHALERGRLERELSEARAQLEHQAMHDGLTDLGNRRLFVRDLDHALAGAQRGTQRTCLLMMDLNRFKAANDRYGHEAGDAVLTEVARRMEATGRANDRFYRLGGDEFTALIDGSDLNGVLALAQRIIDAVSAPIAWNDHELQIGISIGVAPLSADGTDRDELLRAADGAMYQAKRTGRGVACAEGDS